MKNLCRYLLLVLGLLPSLTGCSVIWSGESQPEAAAGAKQAAEPLEQEVAETSWVELLWQVPSEKVEKYHIYYGEQPGNLSSHEEVAVTELTVLYHPKFGKVYQYRINDLPADKSVYIALQAENKAGVSQPTAPIKMEPGQTAPLQ